MKNFDNLRMSFPSLFLAVLGLSFFLGWSPLFGQQDAPQAAPLEGHQLLQIALDRLNATPELTVRFRQEVKTFGPVVRGAGIYVKGSGNRSYFELKIQGEHGQPPTVVQQVCDGKTLWEFRDILGKTELVRVERAHVEEVLKANPHHLPQPLQLQGIGGLARMLSGLQAAFRFHRPRRVVRSSQDQQKQDVAVLRGTWKTESWMRLLPEQAEAIAQGQPPNRDSLPDYLPTEVELHLRSKDLLPVYLELSRLEEVEWAWPWQEKEKLPLRRVPFVTMHFFGHLPRVEDETVFQIDPHDPRLQAAEDRTETFLHQLDMHMMVNPEGME
ncbi:Hypothetical protein PBC10988_12780 [Planctomycetales bacterium 10988]|nr:Hypothetical protein PBC10988_12780 [Planctomycetales bacterium 10988]